MPPPSKEQVTAALGKIRADADKWTDVAASFGRAAGVADRLDLEALHFTYLGDKIGLVDEYRAVQDTFAKLLREGQTNFANMAAVLRKAANDYQTEDEAGAHRIQGATY